MVIESYPALFVPDKLRSILDEHGQQIARQTMLIQQSLIKKNRLRVIDLLSTAYKPNLRAVNEKTRRGYSERILLAALCKKLVGKVSCNKVIKFAKDEHTVYYYPDITYFDEKTNLLIDIEVDEPYSMEDKRPIHYFDEQVNRRIDYDRDNFFTNQLGWVVVRFSEEQVVQHPNLCCAFIEELVKKIERLNFNMTCILKKWDAKSARRPFWTANDVMSMVNTNFRRSYLFPDFPKVVDLPPKEPMTVFKRVVEKRKRESIQDCGRQEELRDKYRGLCILEIARLERVSLSDWTCVYTGIQSETKPSFKKWYLIMKLQDGNFGFALSKRFEGLLEKGDLNKAIERLAFAVVHEVWSDVDANGGPAENAYRTLRVGDSDNSMSLD